MGTAFPLALTRRLADGASPLHLALQAGLRGLTLLAFAIYVQHMNPWLIEKSPGVNTWLACLLGFVLLFPALAHFQATHRERATGLAIAARLAGWIGAAALLLSHEVLPDGDVVELAGTQMQFVQS